MVVLAVLRCLLKHNAVTSAREVHGDSVDQQLPWFSKYDPRPAGRVMVEEANASQRGLTTVIISCHLGTRKGSTLHHVERDGGDEEEITSRVGRVLTLTCGLWDELQLPSPIH